jgi:hypothetical protein
MNTAKPLVPYYNFRTGEYDYLSQAPDDYGDYIPQHPLVQALYRLYLEEGYSATEAAIKVLEIMIAAHAGDARKP